MKQFKVSHQDQELGPLTLEEIVSRVKARELELFDYIYDDAKNDWVLLMEFPELAEQLKSQKPPKPPKQTEVAANTQPAKSQGEEEPTPLRALPLNAHEVTDWYILKGEHRFGPFEYNGVIQMLQQKIVFPFDFVWHAGLENWARINSLPDFKAETLRFLLESKRDQAFAKRQFQRLKVKTRVFVHDSVTLWKGQAHELSQGGLSVSLPSHLLIPGQKLKVHVKSDGKIPAFNAECEVISKSFQPDPLREVEYGLKFLSLSAEAQDQLRKLAA